MATADVAPRRRSLTALLETGIRDHGIELTFLAAIFLARFFLADRNSYWNDEILSIWTYGNSWPTLGESIAALAENSVHPPLYQTVLYGWMQVFGDGEVATRSLSNLFITLAALFLGLLVRRAWGRGVALLSLVGFSLLFTAVFYGLESRSYAQTILLVTVSSWLLLRVLDSSRTPSRAVRVAEAVGVVAVNTALMLTHYYNVFWLVAQAVFVGIHLVLARPATPWWPRIARALLLVVLPQLLFAAIWGQVLLDQYRDRNEGYATEGAAARTPLDLLRSSLVSSNLTAPALVLAVLVIAVGATAIWYAVRIARNARTPDPVAWTYLYLVTWAILPLIVVYVAFTVVGVERYESRYFVYVTPPVVPALVVPVTLAAGWLLRRATRWSPAAIRFVALGLAAALVAVLVAPGSVKGATATKTDWRGIAHTVVGIVDDDPDHSYVILEGGFSARSRMEYYYARFSDTVRSDVQARTYDETRGEYDDVFAQLPEPEEGSDERVILTLGHHQASRFPILIELLDERYARVVTELNDDENGFIIFSADPDDRVGDDGDASDEPTTDDD